MNTPDTSDISTVGIMLTVFAVRLQTVQKSTDYSELESVLQQIAKYYSFNLNSQDWHFREAGAAAPGVAATQIRHQHQVVFVATFAASVHAPRAMSGG